MEPLVALVGRATWQVDAARDEVDRAEAPAWEDDAAAPAFNGAHAGNSQAVTGYMANS